ncbi:glycosyltransferase [Glacieibacterium megasporae]|nr:glycosyltransferase [Polymorphobacter megasporae]UAJ12286.1 glycosyltransferase [Polymorphobacter megasporae]
MRQADIIWTHTESQFLGVAAVVGDGPLILGQAIWLFDRWAGLSSIRRALFRRLIQRLTVLTVHSEDNLAIARALFPKKRVERIPFGIASEVALATKVRSNTPIRVLAIGNDRHRDWATLIAAAKTCTEIEIAIFSGSINRRLANAMPNVKIAVLRTNTSLHQEMARATLVCVPLKANYHASGITVIEEAVLMGVPVVATDTGGLRDYFGDAEIRYVPVGDAAALCSAVRAVASDPVAAAAMADRAQAHLISSGLNADRYIRRHVELSRELLDADQTHKA